MKSLRLNKLVLNLIFIFCLFLSVKAQDTTDQYIQQRFMYSEGIDNKQHYIDFWDGEADGIVSFKDPSQTAKATNAYLLMTDVAQILIENSKVSPKEKLDDMVNLYNLIQKISPANYIRTDYYEPIFINFTGIVEAKSSGQFENVLYKNVQASISNIYLFSHTEHALPFLKRAAYQYPNEVLKEFSQYEEKPYAREVLEHVAKISPQAIKKYLGSKNSMNLLLLSSKDSVVTTLIDLYKKYGAESKVYNFMDMILYDSLSSPALLNSMSQYPKIYLNALIKARQKEHPIGEYDIESELKIKALEQVRKINDLHDENDSTIRFEAARDLNAAELYTLIVYSPEEIFTSTFNGLFLRLQNAMKADSLSGAQLMEEISYNKFRTFIKLCAGYNALGKFLATMTPEQGEDLLHRFVSSLNSNDGDLSEAVNVADTFGSIEDITYLKTLEKYLKEEYEMMAAQDDRKTLYGLLLKLLYKKMNLLPEGILAEELGAYELPSMDEVTYPNLLLDESVPATQMHFFFDDEDGLTSFSTFIASFKAAGWKVEDFPYYVKISGKGKLGECIYANKPLFEREGQQQLSEMVEKGEINPSIIVHRGHSYYAMNTITQIPVYAKIVFLGSCGGYHNISEVVKRAPDVHIIASKQIGTYVVNNNLLVEMSNTISEGKNIVWADLWKRLNERLKGSGTGYERFLDYVPPHKNMGAIFIRAYQQAIGG